MLAVFALLIAVAAQTPGESPATPDGRPPASQPFVLPESAFQPITSSLRGSKHDFSMNGELGRDLCMPCHTPHQVAPPTARLDRRPESVAPLRAAQRVDIELTGPSLMCLGCHDGVTAPDVYTNSHALRADFGPPGASGLRSHPVGVRYPAAAAGYHSPGSVEQAGLPLPDGRIQCTTCHDAHNTHGFAGMLRISDERSGMCLTCHRI